MLSRGLADRKAPVRECAQQLLCQWLASDAGGSVPGLLQLLDVQRHEDACLQVVKHFYLMVKALIDIHGPVAAPEGCILP